MCRHFSPLPAQYDINLWLTERTDPGEMGYFSTWNISPGLPSSWSGRKVSMTTKSLMFTPHQLTCLPPRRSAGYCVEIIFRDWLIRRDCLFLRSWFLGRNFLNGSNFLFWSLKSIISIKQNKFKLPSVTSWEIKYKASFLVKSTQVLWGQN